MKQVKKLAFAGILIAVGVVCSTFSIPVGAAKCAPVQHMVNVLCGVFLGPWYGTAAAFCTSCIRVMMGTGSLLAFPGSMIGALLCGLLYKYTHKLFFAFLGEVVGTGILGALAAYPVAVFLMAKEAAVFGYVVPFMLSSFVGALVSAYVVHLLEKTKVLHTLRTQLGSV